MGSAFGVEGHGGACGWIIGQGCVLTFMALAIVFFMGTLFLLSLKKKEKRNLSLLSPSTRIISRFISLSLLILFHMVFSVPSQSFLIHSSSHLLSSSAPEYLFGSLLE